MFAGPIKHNMLKNAFLKLMDNNPGNDFQANMRIAQLASTMSDSQINAAYGAAHSHATKENSKKNGIFDRKDPYKNVNSFRAQMGHMSALQSNDWMNAFPLVPQQLWMLLRGCGCW
ncbi:MAG: hypothetical protein AAFN74_01140 [Myxococcota bacterium]